MSEIKEFVIFAGVNGAGKTSIYENVLKNDFLESGTRINPDELLTSFQGDWKRQEDRLKSGKLCLRMQNECFQKEVSFHRETTFSSREIIKNIKKALSLNYKVTIYYVHVANVDIALNRVAMRVEKGGHGISEEDVVRRFTRSVENLIDVIKTLPVSVNFYDNTHSAPQIIGYYNENQWTIYENLPWLDYIYEQVNTEI